MGHMGYGLRVSWDGGSLDGRVRRWLVGVVLSRFCLVLMDSKVG